MIRRQRDYPRQLQIGENLWDVVFCRRIPGEPETTLGLCDPSEARIYIRMGQSPEERMKTLIHELAHAVAFEWNVREDHAVIHKLEEPLLRLLIDNGVVL